MNITTASPTAKLTRLREIDKLLATESHPFAAILQSERDAILSTVGNPPLDLIGVTDAKAWAAAFVDTFPTFSHETAEHWFANHALAVADEVQRSAFAQGQQTQAIELIDTLKLILGGLKSNAIACRGIMVKSDGERTSLEVLIVDALATVGVRV